MITMRCVSHIGEGIDDGNAIARKKQRKGWQRKNAIGVMARVKFG
jgi:hypothetical protein